MIIKRVLIENIRSFEQEEIVFPEGSILLSGDIGSGKTSILLAIEFAFFGLQPGQRGTSLLRNGTEEGKVIMDFEVDGKEVEIERTLKRGKTVTQNYCSISINGEKKELSVTELKSSVLDILNYPGEFSKKQNLLYKFTVYTPQEEMKQIILQDPETRVNTLRHVFGIDKYKRIIENINIVLSKIREEKRLKQGLTQNLEEEKENLILKEEGLEEQRYNLVSLE
ncbi:MAG: AAA family ATPase, partial [Minisyncoccales bacterium]